MVREQREILGRILGAHEKLQTRLLLSTRLLGEARIPYAVIGGKAVAAWVATKDESLVRNTPDVDILVRPADFPKIKEALEAGGFVHRRVADTDMFLDDVDSKERDAVQIT
jgi:hypothetical protein